MPGQKREVHASPPLGFCGLGRVLLSVHRCCKNGSSDSSVQSQSKSIQPNMFVPKVAKTASPFEFKKKVPPDKRQGRAQQTIACHPGHRFPSPPLPTALGHWWIALSPPTWLGLTSGQNPKSVQNTSAQAYASHRALKGGVFAVFIAAFRVVVLPKETTNA